MKYIRYILGGIIVFFDSITRPKPLKWSQDQQKNVDKQTSNLKLYQFHGCPFCVKVRRTIHKLNLNVELVDAKDPKHESDLERLGGKRKVPCLKISEGDPYKWMYESKDIISYLVTRFGQNTAELNNSSVN